MNAIYALYGAALLLGALLLAGLFKERRRADKMTGCLTCFMGCTVVLWALLGFLQLGADDHRAIVILKSCRGLVGGMFIGLAIALFTHALLKRREAVSSEIKPVE
jgi:hypothetical protein